MYCFLQFSSNYARCMYLPPTKALTRLHINMYALLFCPPELFETVVCCILSGFFLFAAPFRGWPLQYSHRLTVYRTIASEMHILYIRSINNKIVYVVYKSCAISESIFILERGKYQNIHAEYECSKRYF